MTQLEQNNEIFRTKSLNLAAFLVVTGRVELVEIDKTDPKEIWFVFSPKDVCCGLERTYWNDEASVNPKKLLYVLNELKDRMFN